MVMVCLQRSLGESAVSLAGSEFAIVRQCVDKCTIVVYRFTTDNEIQAINQSRRGEAY